jgi:hypothetical protein
MACGDLSVQDEGAVYRLEEKGIDGDQLDECKTCRNEPACDSGGRSDIDVGSEAVIVGTPPGAGSLPQWNVHWV